MPYSRKQWIENETPLSAGNMNNIEDGIEEAMAKSEGSTEMWEYIRNLVYPVGSIYMSATLDTKAKVEAALGGTWEAWGKGRVPVGVNPTDSKFDTAEETGGSADASIVSHDHTATFKGNTVNGHRHNGPSHTHGTDSHSHGPGGRNHSRFLRFFNWDSTAMEDIGINIDVGNDITGASNWRYPRVHNTSGCDFAGTERTEAVSITINPAGTGETSSAGGHTPSGTVTVNSRGSAGTNKNLQPYITCYMWKRTG